MLFGIQLLFWYRLAGLEQMILVLFLNKFCSYLHYFFKTSQVPKTNKNKRVQRCSRSKSCYNDPIYLSKHSIVCKENFFKYWCMKNLLNGKNVDSPSVFKLAACFSKVSESPISVSKYDNLMIHFAYPALSSRSCNLKRSWGLRIEKSPWWDTFICLKKGHFRVRNCQSMHMTEGQKLILSFHNGRSLLLEMIRSTTTY